jgi:hypothetical protein
MIFTNLHAENNKHINVTAVVWWKTEKDTTGTVIMADPCRVGLILFV